MSGKPSIRSNSGCSARSLFPRDRPIRSWRISSINGFTVRECHALKLTYSVKGKPGAWKLTGTVTQSEVPDDFSVTVPVEIQTGKGKVIRQIRTGSEPVQFSVPVKVANAKAVLDPASSVLRR